MMDWEKPGIAELTISVCLAGSKFNFARNSIFFLYLYFTGLVFFHLFFWMCTQIRQNVYKFLKGETQTNCSMIKDLRNEKEQPIYVLPFHYVR